MNDSLTPPDKGIAVALGGGGARGLAHICVIEAMDELGLAPAAIAGVSIGAVIGAAWAAGIPGRDIREHVEWLNSHRADAITRVFRSRATNLNSVFSRGINPVLLDGEKLLDQFWPEAVPDRFEDLPISFSCIATDFYARREAVFSSGPLTPAVAASMAIPGLIKPVMNEAAVLVDGGAVNPLPYRLLMNRGWSVVACDVTGGPVESKRATPAPFEALFGAGQIMQASITREMLKASQPDILLRPDVDRFRVLDFFRARTILAAAEPVKDDVKRAIAQLMDGARSTP